MMKIIMLTFVFITYNWYFIDWIGAILHNGQCPETFLSQYKISSFSLCSDYLCALFVCFIVDKFVIKKNGYLFRSLRGNCTLPTILNFILHYNPIPYYTFLYYTILYYTTLHYNILYYTMLWYIYTILHLYNFFLLAAVGTANVWHWSLLRGATYYVVLQPECYNPQL